ncbi:MAG: hypothetical protein E7305_07265 [Butyrivibrio sp.]|nr:hypothetical protein [Butyrivibrio sp.]
MADEKLYSWKPEEQDVFKNITVDNSFKQKDQQFADSMAFDQNRKDAQKRENKDKEAENGINIGIDEELAEKREIVDANMPGTISVFSGKEKLIRSAKYTYVTTEGDRKVEKKGSRTPSRWRMKPILDHLNALDALLDKVVDLKKVEEIQNEFREICLACEKYIRHRNPWTDEGKARKQMVQDIYEQVKTESLRFSVRVEQLSTKPEENGLKTWLDVLRDVRTEKFEDGVDGATVTIGGAGTSKVYIVEKNGKKQYFKETEKIPSDDYDVLTSEAISLAQDELRAYEADNRHTKKDKEDFSSKITQRSNALKAVMDCLKYLFKDFDSIGDFFDDHRDPDKIMDGIVKALDDKEKELEKKDTVLENHIITLRNIIEKKDEIGSVYGYVSETLHEISKKARCHDIAVSSAMIKENADLSRRNVASARMAKLLGLNGEGHNLIADSKLADVIINGKTMHGILMDEASGVVLTNYSKHSVFKTRYSADAFRSLLNLQIYDIIMGQVDRNTGNYLGAIKEDKMTGSCEVLNITGIDNDMCGGVLRYSDIFIEGKSGYNRIRNIVVDNSFQPPAIEKELADNIMKLTPEIIHFQFCDIFDKDERRALIDRLSEVQKVIKILKKKHQDKIIERNDKAKWTTRMMEFSKVVGERMRKDVKDANDEEKRLMDDLDIRKNDKKNKMTQMRYLKEKAKIKNRVNNIKMRTVNLVKSKCYLRTDYLFTGKDEIPEKR